MEIFGLVAHQGGWDEALLIAGPIAAIAGLLMLAKKRVDAAAEMAAADSAPEPADADA
mgnify:CR=1 FL=1